MQQRQKDRIKAVIPEITAQEIRRDIGPSTYMASDGTINSPGGTLQGLDNINSIVTAIAGKKDGLVTFYAFLIKRLTDLKKQKLKDPLFSEYSSLFELLRPRENFGGNDRILINIHLLRSLLYRYQTKNDDSSFSIKDDYNVDSIRNPGSSDPKQLTFSQSEFGDNGVFEKLHRRLIKKLVAKEAIDLVKQLQTRSIEQPDEWYYEQARKVLDGGSATYSRPPQNPDGSGNLTNLVGYQNIQYIAGGMGIVAVTLIGGALLTKFRN